MTDWQNRPLDRVCPVLFIDVIFVKIRDGQVDDAGIGVEEAASLSSGFDRRPGEEAFVFERALDRSENAPVRGQLAELPAGARS